MERSVPVFIGIIQIVGSIALLYGIFKGIKIFFLLLMGDQIKGGSFYTRFIIANFAAFAIVAASVLLFELTWSFAESLEERYMAALNVE